MSVSKETSVCPICGQPLKRHHFIGYYDEFWFWDCVNDKCTDKWDSEDIIEIRGAYA